MRRYLPYWITQCYLPPDTSELSPPNPSKRGWYLIYQPRMDGRLSLPRWLVTYRDGLPVSRPPCHLGLHTTDLSHKNYNFVGYNCTILTPYSITDRFCLCVQCTAFGYVILQGSDTRVHIQKTHRVLVGKSTLKFPFPNFSPILVSLSHATSNETV